ncbi:hypothetical protein BDP27DRAFT_849017 [Rhodocollybia butyracea]|uniref:DUF1764-domain-containing protein n=1 Tax=Rhodocollybia butyracea TaxID=206335 RepID=A0A9P5PU05_9AGAR|nr:hypothetical protein BDP27DRAFT_849017 [Rhodocollybia butyracea]
MAKSEIDDIFASKGKALPIASSSTVSKPTKKDKKRKRKAETAAVENPSSSSKKVPETIIDPSASIPSAKRQKVAKSSEKATKGIAETKKSAKEDEYKFTDSRGSGPRRKTEEGWSIYKADELGLKDDDEGGDTSLCPFDCDCCF